MARILFVFTSCNKTLTGAQTGWYLPEAAHPYYVLAPHHTIDFAAPAGPNPPVDESSVQMFKDDESVKFLNDPTVQQKFASAKKLSDVSAKDYDAVFYVGGHGPVIDLASDPVNIKFASEVRASFSVKDEINNPTRTCSSIAPARSPLLSATDLRESNSGFRTLVMT
ncbi:hypothetical protein AcW1_004420 [Taiwanofungus camphoratus]|nr:hypothetical protein AcW2_006573 [Antrodia cinnamomea]KAI0939345.1 hypothetical protein AcV5_000796 [Antrodia cinnamomea]KAI0952265.1 hypothetical protein AcV7_008135 [Antrodia cinnamomea]KAI0959646.1 hypothetical protein AcW1_004420 [Antrodia cinnamomea]